MINETEYKNFQNDVGRLLVKASLEIFNLKKQVAELRVDIEIAREGIKLLMEANPEVHEKFGEYVVNRVEQELDREMAKNNGKLSEKTIKALVDTVSKGMDRDFLAANSIKPEDHDYHL